ncbi:MAG: hypothetical protein GF398_00575 [Chitinivibrionales bacterium]|nr:hypothetical protein [Chitinivibrionales bacterium]
MKVWMILFCAGVGAFGQFFAQRSPILTDIDNYFDPARALTNPATYNELDHNGNPLGLLDIEQREVSLNLAYRHFHLTNDTTDDRRLSSNAFRLPYLQIGKPGVAIAQFRYGLSLADCTWVDETQRIPLNRFGFTVAGQSSSKRFRIGLDAQAFVGRQNSDDTDVTRFSGGLNSSGLYMGSELDELVRIGFYGRVYGMADTLDGAVNPALKATDRNRDLFGQLILPLIGVDLDVGKEDFPYLANFNFDYAKKHFVSNFLNSNQDAIVSDSLTFHFKNMASIVANDFITVMPAFNLRFFSTNHQLWETEGDNLPIVDYKEKRSGHTFRTRSFQFGIGSSVGLTNYATMWAEYGRANLNLEVNDDYTFFPDSIPENNGYNRFGIGFDSPVHQLPFIKNVPASIEIYFKFAYVLMQENALLNTYRSDQFTSVHRLVLDNGLGTQTWRYLPWETIACESSLHNTMFGAGATFLDKKFAVDLHLGILRQKHTSLADDDFEEKYKGIEFGIDLTYNVFGELAERSDEMSPNESPDIPE